MNYGLLWRRAEAPYGESTCLLVGHMEGIHLQNSISIFTRKNEPLSAAAANFIQLIRSNPY
jgi:hypothetical protein